MAKVEANLVLEAWSVESLEVAPSPLWRSWPSAIFIGCIGQSLVRSA